MSTGINVLHNSIQLGGGYINPKGILEYVSEEEIFQLVFGFLPVEYEKVTSPFRDDSTPGCYFERTFKGKLRFKDFANAEKYKNIKLSNIDCFDAVVVHFKLNNLYEALDLIQQKLIFNQERTKKVVNSPFKKDKLKSKVFFDTRDFMIEDGEFWGPYGITPENLNQDLVYPVVRVLITNTKNGDISYNAQFFTYAYTDFKSGNRKIYSPYNSISKFVTDCTENDIGGIRHLVKEGKKLVISKSYKDYRVLKNVGLNVIWLHSESIVPSIDILLDITKNFTEVIVFYDNDEAGIKGSKNISDTINMFQPNKARPFYLPTYLNEFGIKDPADFRKAYENKEFIQMLAYYNVL